jgi:P27 family predicted phage terminase small subunit
MMKLGPKPLPPNLKLITNSHRKAKNPPLPEPCRPKPPQFLDKYAKEEWDRCVNDLCAYAGLSKIDVAVFAAYCQSYATWREASDLLAEFHAANPNTRGLVIFTKKSRQHEGGNLIQNPVVGLMNKAKRDMVYYASELGMTPSARSRIDTDAAQRAQAPDPTARYFAS